jgi:hypothetical protein
MIAPDDGWAVGYDILHWDGTAWTMMPLRLNPYAFVAVDMVSSTDVWVGGSYSFLRYNYQPWLPRNYYLPLMMR